MPRDSISGWGLNQVPGDANGGFQHFRRCLLIGNMDGAFDANDPGADTG
jgi:hypothetical protein